MALYEVTCNQRKGLSDLTKAVGSARTGTAMHNALQRIDLRRIGGHANPRWRGSFASSNRPAGAAASPRRFVPAILALVLFASISHSSADVIAWGGDSVSGYTLNGTMYVAHIFTSSGAFEVGTDGNVEILVVGGCRADGREKGTS